LKGKLDADLKLARASEDDQLPPLLAPAISLQLDSLRPAAEALLAKTPDLSNTIEHLTQNADIESWVEDGLKLHADKESCEFCGGSLEAERLDAFKVHFSKDIANYKQEIESLVGKLNAAKASFAAPKDAEVNPPFRASLKAQAESLQGTIATYNKVIDRFGGGAREKTCCALLGGFGTYGRMHKSRKCFPAPFLRSGIS